MEKEFSDKWYLLQYKWNNYNIALENLRRQKFETFFPLLEKTKRTNTKFENYSTPLFPGYIFITFNINEQRWVKIKSTRGISRIICFGNKPTEVPSNIIFNLKKKCNSKEVICAEKKIDRGTEVNILKGPFAGFVGRIEDFKDDNRVYLLLKYMEKNQNLSIEIENTDLIL